MAKNLINGLEEFEKNNDYKEIIHTINQIISIKPELKEKLLLKRAIAYKELEAYEKAIKSFKDYEIYCNSQDKYKLFIMIADCYEELQDSEKENEYLLKSFNLKPTTYSTKKIGLNYYLNRDYEKCMEFIELLKERDLADIEDLTNLIYCYNHLNKTKEAVECCNDILKLDPNNIEIYISLTMAYEKEGNMKKLMETYSQIVELDVDEDEETLLIKAQSYMGLGQEETAIEYVNKSIKLKPYDPVPYIMKGMLLQNCNKTEEALECYDEAYNLDSELITIISDEINR